MHKHSDVFWDLTIEKIASAEPSKHHTLEEIYELVLSARNIKEVVKEAIDKIWLLIFITFNPIAPIFIVSVVFGVAHYFKPQIEWLKNSGKPKITEKEAYDIVASKNIKIRMKLEDPDEAINTIEKHRNS